jgi:glucose/arabinose dehydrogenase
MIYAGELFAEWRGDAFIPGLSSQALVRVAIEGDEAREVERFDMGARMRAVQQDAEGAIWLLEDGAEGRLLELKPR